MHIHLNAPKSRHGLRGGGAACGSLTTQVKDETRGLQPICRTSSSASAFRLIGSLAALPLSGAASGRDAVLGIQPEVEATWFLAAGQGR